MTDSVEERPMAPMIGRVLAPKPYMILAGQLREAILSGEIPENTMLPSERLLVEQSGLTRGAVREALKTLAGEGLVQTKPGRFGGNVVTLPGRESVAVSLNQFVRGRQLPLRVLHETRTVLEPALARLAALHRTDADLDALARLHRDLVDAAGNFQAFSRANIRWHSAVASASHNDLLAAALEAISYGVAVSTTVHEYDTPETRDAVIAVHAGILAAIEDGDGETAERRMRHHLSATHSRVADPDSTVVPMSGSDDVG
ncbi:FCD domain-containing protein [Cnuibacter physcomitrellae]|uniref:FadR/GntR family transcriptional regulator n=1 Tax=Cnuibacter physcomitrellae TaxID=1619308 RepID=UPI0021759CE2|nr:FCD domain-containing protein [Cnuibacter physcomitrellae]MCS5498251.1 FCD domain-containing protein [Cnuibacter physcomitrellae]